MEYSDGRKRVIIENISPQVDSGKYPAKRVINENVEVAADIFSDGHDVLRASVYFRFEGAKKWEEVPMKHLVNDRWKASFKAEKLGFYEFKVAAWIDHFATWKYGFKKKSEAHQDVKVESLIGAEMLEHASQNATKTQKDKLLTWIEEFKNPGNNGSLVSLALSEEVAELVDKVGDKSNMTEYPQIFKVEIEREKAGYSTWYELFPRSASDEPGKHGTFKDVKKLLPRIAEMGFDTLYFPPIHPIGEVNRKGKNNALKAEKSDPGSPWAIGSKKGGHKSIHPELGTLKDLKDLIKEAKKYNIEIALDIAYQCAPDHPYVKEHPEWFRWRPDGTVQYAENPPKKYEDILPINFESEDWKGLWEELKSVVEYWIEQGINVFRVDNPHTKAFPFWEWMIKEVRTNHPQVIFLAEAFTRPRVMERLGKIGFNQSYTYFTWRHSKKEFEEYITELTKTDVRDFFRPNFWPNTPDILPPILTYGGEPAFIMRLILAGTISSNYGLYGPVYEFGINTPMPNKEEYVDNEKYEIKQWDWDQYTRIKEVIARLNRIRRQNPALQSTWNIHLGDCNNEQILSFAKVDKETGNKIIVAVNLDPYHVQEGNIYIPIHELGIRPDLPYIVNDLLSGEKYRWHGNTAFVKLNPHEMPAHIFKVEQ